MQYSYSLHQEAYEEFLDAVEWYKERGQATRYRAKIKQAIQAIRAAHGLPAPPVEARTTRGLPEADDGPEFRNH